jgi:hypothetical protein
MRARTVLAAAALAAAVVACSSEGPVTVRVSLPGVTPFPPGTFAEIIVTDFRNAAVLPELDPGLELQSYLADELRRAFDGKVSVLPLPAAAEASPAFWKEAAAGRSGAVFVTGTIRMSTQIRKALKKDLNVPVDGPFDNTGRALVELRRWTITIDLAVISGQTGEPVYARTFRDDRDYIDLEKPADFAFSELSAAFRDRLFPILLGSFTIEKRTLLRLSAGPL